MKAEQSPPLDVDGEEACHLQRGSADGGCEGFALAVAEEEHLQDVGVIDGHSASSHLSVAVLQGKQERTHAGMGALASRVRGLPNVPTDARRQFSALPTNSSNQNVSPGFSGRP